MSVSQPEPKRSDIKELHRLTLQVSPECKLWFFDGKNSKNRETEIGKFGIPLTRIDTKTNKVSRQWVGRG